MVTFGECPYHHLGTSELLLELDDGLRLEVPEIIDDDVKAYIYGCWHQKPEFRYNFIELVDFFARKISNESLLYYESLMK